MSGSIHIYPNRGRGWNPYGQLADDVRRGNVRVGDIVEFGWEGGRKNLVKTASVGEDGNLNLHMVEIVDSEK